MTDELKTSPRARERELFFSAIEKTAPGERAAFLHAACGNDHALRHCVEELLREHADAGSFLETPAMSGGIAAVTEKPGDRIGRYKLLQKIGEGGCGIVYMAEQQEPVRRRVALKVIKLGMDTKSVIARFEAERQALAMMEHPNIAKVFDAGATDTGRPFFVMELVRGIKFTDYCNQNSLSTEERLQLFIQVCRAIQHAHQKGVVHRDIKPSNILVTLHDGAPVPKVIDFGIAKATEQRLTDKTLFTEFHAFIGTPAYMSPEQAEMSSLDIDTRSDIYSLGVLLYELLTGKTPFDAENLIRAGLDECRRTIRETEPVRPSTRLATMIEADLTIVARQRRTEALKLVHLLRGDLDWIVMKCLEKDRVRRYETVNGLAMDIEHYLDSEPITARPPSAAYRIQKFVRRNKVIVSAGGAIAAALLLAALVSTWQAIRARQAEREQGLQVKQTEQALLREVEYRQRANTQELAALRRAYNSEMNLVQQALAANNYGRAVDLLNRHRPKATSESRNSKSEIEQDFRQWEWRYFWSQSQSDAAFALPQQSNSINAIAISPNGRLLASRDMHGAVKLWDLIRQTELAVIRERGPGRAAFAFSWDGGRLATAVSGDSRRSMVKVWTVATRQVSAEFPHEGGIDSLAFSPDDTKLLVLGHDLAVRIWDFQTQQLEKQLTLRIPGTPLEGWPRKAVFSPDGRSIAVAVAGRIHLLYVDTGAERSSMVGFEEGIASLAFSPNGALLAASPLFTETERAIKLFATATGKEVGPLIGHVSWVPGLTFTSDGRRIVSAGADQTVRIWDVDSRQELAALRGHLNEVLCVAVTPDGKSIVSGCKDGTLFGWDAGQSGRKQPFATLPIRIADLQFFPDSQAMLSVNVEGSVSLWDPTTLQEKERLSALGTNVMRILLAPDGSRLFAGTRGGEIKVLDLATRLVITNLVGFSGDLTHQRAVPVGLIHQGRTLIAAEAEAIRVWDTASWHLKATWKGMERSPFPGTRMVVSHDERFLLVPNRSGGIDYRDLQTGQPGGSLPGHMWSVWAMAYSPDGSLLATASADGTVNLYDPSTGEMVDVLRGHLLGVHAVAFSPDGQRLASVSHGNEAVKLWDVATRHDVATLAGEGALFDLAKFSPDGKLLVAVNRQGKAHIWRAPSLDDIAAAEAQRPRPH